MKKIVLFLIAFICINQALEAKIWRSNWPYMSSSGGVCVAPSGSVVEFDLILDVTDPNDPALNNFYLNVNGVKHILTSFTKSENGGYTKHRKRIYIPHFNNQTITYNISHPIISGSLFKNYPQETQTKNVCSGGESGIQMLKLTGNTNLEIFDNANSDTDFINLTNSLNIGPNPFNDNLKISYVTSDEEEISIEMFDLNGRVVKKKLYFIKQSDYYTEHWDTSDLARGVYYCKLSSNLKQNIVKLIKN